MPGGDDLAAAIHELQALTEELRRACPWDRVQTERTIVPHTVEEAYEVADAAQDGDDEKLADELGDLLYQVFFLSLLMEERGSASLAEIARGVHEKLVHRHPHVFGTAQLDSPEDVRERWDALKAREAGRAGIFHDVPESLPALLRARKVQWRAAAARFDYASLESAMSGLRGELAELEQALEGHDDAPEVETSERLFAETGDVLFSLVNVARKVNVDPELALASAVARFTARVERAERLAREAGHDFGSLTLDEQERYYCDAKRLGA
ncbi:MAG: nucleoside triphosphate pyrophosphohydrolase [Actinomycetia bacterium]|nr:nucleoside triphosphate pyrophosphohydrolase [Actinomycetes bacterium]